MLEPWGSLPEQEQRLRSLVRSNEFYRRIVTLMWNTATAGGLFEFTRTASANLREKDDSWNQAIGGFFGGAVFGLRCQSISRNQI